MGKLKRQLSSFLREVFSWLAKVCWNENKVCLPGYFVNKYLFRFPEIHIILIVIVPEGSPPKGNGIVKEMCKDPSSFSSVDK